MSKLTIFFVISSQLVLQGCGGVSGSKDLNALKSSLGSDMLTSSNSLLSTGVTRHGNSKIRVDYVWNSELQNAVEHQNHDALVPAGLSGSVRVSAFVVNLTGGDYPANSISPEQVEKILFTGQEDGFSLKKWWERASNNKITISGHAYAATLPPIDDAGMGTSAFFPAIEAAAVSSGYNPADYAGQYTIKLYFMPKLRSGCTSGGSGVAWYMDFNHSNWLGEMNLTDQASLSSRKYAQYVILHEFGHALGMPHDDYDQSYDADGNEIAGSSDNSISMEYGDHNSVMGGGTVRTVPDKIPHLQFEDPLATTDDVGVPGAYTMDRLGWATSKVISSSGTFDIYPLNQPAASGQTQILKFPRAVYRDANLNTPVSRQNFYISYKNNRLPLSFGHGPNELAPAGINVQFGFPGNNPNLVRFKLNGDTADQLLLVGETYFDSISHATVKLNSIDSTTGAANVTVTLPIAPSKPVAPQGLSAIPISSSEAEITFTAGFDGYGNQVKAHRMVIDGRIDRTYPYISCQTAIEPGTYIQPWKCRLRDHCGGPLNFRVSELGAGRTHEIKVYALDGFGNMSDPVTTYVTLPTGADLAPPGPISDLRVVSVTAVNPALPVSRTNAGSITVAFTQGNDEDRIQALMWLNILPNAQYPNGRQYGYGAGTTWTSQMNQPGTITFSSASFPLYSGQHFKIVTSTRDQAGNDSHMHYWPKIENPSIEVDVP